MRYSDIGHDELLERYDKFIIFLSRKNLREYLTKEEIRLLEQVKESMREHLMILQSLIKIVEEKQKEKTEEIKDPQEQISLFDELMEAAKPLADYLKLHHNLHTIAIVTSNKIEILESARCIPNMKKS